MVGLAQNLGKTARARKDGKGDKTAIQGQGFLLPMGSCWRSNRGKGIRERLERLLGADDSVSIDQQLAGDGD